MPNLNELAVSAMPAVASTAAMEPTAVATTIVESIVTAELASTMEFAPTKAIMFESFVRESSAAKTVTAPAALAKLPASVKPAPIVATAVEAATIKTGASIESVKPRARADEHAIDKPFRAVVAVRRAGVRVIIVIAVGANGCRGNIGRTNSHANNHSLRARIRHAKEANAE